MKQALKWIWQIISYVLLFVGMQGVVMGLLWTTVPQLPRISAEVEAVLMSITFGIALSSILTLLVVWLFLHKEWEQENFWEWQQGAGTNMGLCALAGIFINGAIIGILYFFQLDEIFQDHGELMERIVQGNPLVIFITVVFLAPILEEVIFRGIILHRLMRTSMNTWLAIIIPALLFGIIHGNVLQGSYAFIIGIAFGLVYVWFRSIWAPIIMHITFNMNLLPGLLSSYLPGNENEASMSEVAFTLIAIALLLVSISLLWVLWKRRKVVDSIEL